MTTLGPVGGVGAIGASSYGTAEFSLGASKSLFAPNVVESEKLVGDFNDLLKARVEDNIRIYNQSRIRQELSGL